MYQDTRQRHILVLTFLLSIPCSFVRADSPPSPNDIDPQGSASYTQYSTEQGTVIVSKPVKQGPVDDPTFEDFLHVIVACLLALLLTTLLGLFIRHYGLTLHPFTRSGRTKLPSPAARDAEKHPGPNTRSSQGGVGLGLGLLKVPGPGTGGGLDDSELPEKPRAAHLKWR